MYYLECYISYLSQNCRSTLYVHKKEKKFVIGYFFVILFLDYIYVDFCVKYLYRFLFCKTFI